MQLDRGMFAQKRLHSLGLVRRQVVGDHVNLLTGRLMCDDVGENATNRSEVCRAAVLPITSPVFVLNAAYSASYHWRPLSSITQGAIVRV